MPTLSGARADGRCRHATIRACFAIGQQADEAQPPGRIGAEAKPASPLGASFRTALDLIPNALRA